ncbi:MAG TPA: hypothetical protein VJ608_02355 [Albitalea sp.]|nr:hypothetical protein [Albitalea sp.]
MHYAAARRASRWAVVAAWVLACIGSAAAQTQPADAAAALQARHAELASQLEHNVFGRTIVLQSTEASNDLRGEIYAVVEHPFAEVDEALQGAGHWCDILILHLNVKGCVASERPQQSSLAVSIGRKFDQPLADAYRVDFNYRVASRTPGYLEVLLNADSGPFSTRDYRIALEAVPLDRERSFIHLSYSYRYGFAAKLAMQTYLGTLGRDKLGFTVERRRSNGEPVYVGGVRGVVERNTMRYYLAIDAFLDSLALPPPQQLERRLHDWFAATERYARQLHELDQSEYLAMKRKEVQRQRSAPG